jgi:hypothetical protein
LRKRRDRFKERGGLLLRGIGETRGMDEKKRLGVISGPHRNFSRRDRLLVERPGLTIHTLNADQTKY